MHAAAVALAVHVAGAVQHLLKRDEALLDHVVGRLAVLAHRGVERAGVLVLDRLAAAAAGGRPGSTSSGRCSRQRRGPGPAGPASKNERSIYPPGFRAFSERARDGLRGTRIIVRP